MVLALSVWVVSPVIIAALAKLYLHAYAFSIANILIEFSQILYSL